MPRLSKRVVDCAELRETPYFIWCAELSGFGVRVFPSGKKVYYADYRAEGRRRRMTLGPHGKLTTEEARRLALGTLGGVVKGDDPLLERKTRRSSLTVAQLCDRYLEAADRGLILGKGGTAKKPATLAIDRGRIAQHIKPLLGRHLVIDLRRADVVKFIRDVTAGKTARAGKSDKPRGRVRVTGGPGAAARTAGLLGGILTYAVSEGILDFNPATGVKKPAGNRRDRRLTAGEYRAFGQALDAAAETAPWQAVAMLRLLALTGCRLGEVEALKWGEVDLDSRVLRLDDSKTGRSVRPLGAPAAELLEGLGREDDNPYVFPAARLHALPYAGLKRFYRGLFKTAGLDGVTPHVLRHSFASVGADLGFTDSTIGACLGHAAHGITSRYTHRLDSVLIAAADRIAGEIAQQMTLRG